MTTISTTGTSGAAAGMAAVAVALGLMMPAAAEAELVITASPEDARVIDTDGDGTGNSLNRTDGYFFVGESANDADASRIVIPFVLTDDVRQQIDSAPDTGGVMFSIQLNLTESVDGFAVDLYGFTKPADDPLTLSTDYQADAGDALIDGAFTPDDPLGVKSFDVTSFVKQAVADDQDGAQVIYFRLQMNPDTLPIADGNRTFYRFISASHNLGADQSHPTLTIVPEPGSLGLLAAGALLIARRR